jgi:DNA modification methylase
MTTITQAKISDVKANPNNPRLIKDDKFDKLVKSIKDFPEMLRLRPIVVNSDMVVLGGNMRLKACKEAGLKEVPIIRADELTDDQQREFIIKDNVGFGEWEWDMIRADWDVNELSEWGLDIPEFETTELEAVEDDYEMPDQVETDIVLGDLYEIGEHRLLCGDSTDSDQVAKLMDGKLFKLLATSPPYNQGNNTGDLLTNGKKAVRLYDDKNADNRSSDEYYKFCIDILNTSFLFKDDESHTICWNVAYNAKSRSDYGKIIFGIDNPFEVKETIVWDKGHAINLPQVGIYSRRCEFVFVMSSNEKYHTSQTYNDCRWNIYNISTMNSQTTDGAVEHRAAFPIKFAEQMINDFSVASDLIYEPFTGSGTTMVASHQLKRKCYGMELDPKYCQVIVDRMIKLDPSLTIKRNGEPYQVTGEKQVE